VLTTFTSYGAVAFSRQAEILSNLQNVAAPADAEPDAATIHRVIAHLQNKSRL
jgi:hypothetical protein